MFRKIATATFLLMFVIIFTTLGQARAITLDDVASSKKFFFPKKEIVIPQPVAVLSTTTTNEANETPTKPKVYLTFDDGPNAAIGPILDILKEKEAKATFFMLEPLMRQYSDQVKRLVQEGHYPALHSVTHDRHQLYEGDPTAVAAEMEQTRQTLLEITGIDSKLTRVPYGSKPYMTDAFREPFVASGFKMWDWTIDTVDWKFQRDNPQMIVTNFNEGFEAVKGTDKPLIVLMHVNEGTASVLASIIDYIHSQGYECAAYNPDEHISMNFWQDGRL